MDMDYIFNVHTFAVKYNLTSLKLNRFELENLFLNRDSNPFEKVQKRFTRILSIAYKIQDKYQISELISQGVDSAFKSLPEGELANEADSRAIINEVVKKIVPFIMHRNNS
jgi:hypothetical protein